MSDELDTIFISLFYYFISCKSCKFFIFIFTFCLWKCASLPMNMFTAAAGSRYVRTIKPTNSADCYDKPRRPRSVRHISCESKQVDLEHNASHPHSVVVGGGVGVKKRKHFAANGRKRFGNQAGKWICSLFGVSSRSRLILRGLYSQ